MERIEGEGGATICVSAGHRKGKIDLDDASRARFDSKSQPKLREHTFLFHASCERILFDTKGYHAQHGQAKEFVPEVDYKTEDLLLARLKSVVLLSLPPFVPVLDLPHDTCGETKCRAYDHLLDYRNLERKH